MSFVHTSTSLDRSVPDIEFMFAGETCTAELAGARLYAEMRFDGTIDMRITDRHGEVLVEIIVCKRMHRNATENLTDVGSALLWSHWRHCEMRS